MRHQDIVIVKRWIPILEEYERTRAKVTPRPFKFVKDLCEAHHIKKKELRRYYCKWLEGGRKPESLLPSESTLRPKGRSFSPLACWKFAPLYNALPSLPVLFLQ